ncbi:MAG TPA: carbohydrate ABC transporter permease [Candidatus Limiplasma pullicola]|jgi:putative aldouronate transport system permease protein|uniref:carbohydrate ABC transporter permease n=1 Tax=Ruthenibacterium lactatiformans TaxID=1550024 RepID=UPI001FA49A36|nr:carbohydrate ABC transporter permease [Candidatus Limiplasma pullicola]
MNHHHAMTRSAHAVLILLTLAAIVPFVLLIIASFTDNNVAITEGFSFFPSKWSTDAYQYIVNEKDTMLRAYGITIVVTLIGTTLGLLISVMLAYSLANSDLPGRNFMTFFVTLTMLFNGGLVPTYLIYTNVFHIKDTLAALIVPNLLMNGFNVILIRNYFATGVPTVLYEAARIDGASEFYIFYRIALPLSKPILATVGLLMGIAYWNDWQNGLYYLNDTSLYSIQNILNRINENISFLASNSTSGVKISDLPTSTIRMAIAVIGILPIVCIYPFFQEYFVRGIAVGAVKG